MEAFSVLDGIMYTTTMDFIYNRNREVIEEIKKTHGMKLDKNGCYV